ncbi:MAG: ABA4-like family protein [Pseudomonadota bacterium]
MSPEQLFSISGNFALPGWLILAASPLAPVWANRIGGVAIPIILSVLYAAAILAFWSSGTGGFDSLPNVMALFDHPGVATAGWIHFLAFDLAVGGWIVREARRRKVPHWMVLPCLFMTLMFGPVGLLMFLAIATIRQILGGSASNTQQTAL